MQRRDAVLRAMKDHPISQRRACVLIGVDPKTVRREHPPDNPEVRLEMNKIAEKRRRFGYRRILTIAIKHFLNAIYPAAPMMT